MHRRACCLLALAVWALALLFLLVPAPAYAGGIYIVPGSVHITPEEPSGGYAPGTELVVLYQADQYAFSGRAGQAGWVGFQVRARTAVGSILLVPLDRLALLRRLPFEAPAEGGRYTLSYTFLPIWLPRELSAQVARAAKAGDWGGVVELDSLPEAVGLATSKILKDEGKWVPIEVDFHVGKPLDLRCEDLAVYLKLDGEIPSAGRPLEGGVRPKPALVSWKLGPRTPPANAEFRWRLYPDDQEWSAWAPETELPFFFLPAGRHELAVEGRWPAHDPTQHCTTGAATYAFTLDTPLVAKPDEAWIAKASSIPPGAASVTPQGPLYQRSYALLVGVANYDDPSFAQLPQVKKDVERVKQALLAQGFEVLALSGRVTREEVLQAIDKIATASPAYDRVILYFSGHGFEDEIVKGRAYLAMSGCSKSSPTARCLSLDDLKGVVQGRLGVRSRQVLIIADNCVAGLGLISKVAGYPKVGAVAGRPAVHMFTAGIGTQLALIKVELEMSLMSYALVAGLDGKADYTRDGYVSLSELLVYVQYAVALDTDGKQVPMLGRLGGDGEMVFKSLGRAQP